MQIFIDSANLKEIEKWLEMGVVDGVTTYFCSDRCKILDLGAWSAEAYRVPEKPEESQGESWSAADEES